MIDRTTDPSMTCGRRLVFRTCTVILLVLQVASCAGVPQLDPANISADQGRISDCIDVFPTGRWRFVHAVETVFSGKPTGVVVGVTVIDQEKRTAEAIIMTLEGLVLFHARSSADTKDAIDIQRAIAPFDSPDFARGLIEDVSLLFLAPVTAKSVVGFSAGETFTCRYILADTSVVDVMPAVDGSWQINQYDRRQNLRRRASADPLRGCPSSRGVRLPCRIELEAIQRPAYALRMSLIEAEKITE